MAADFADSPCATVAGMQAGMGAGSARGCRQHPSTSQMSTLIAGAICLKTSPHTRL